MHCGLASGAPISSAAALGIRQHAKLHCVLVTDDTVSGITAEVISQRQVHCVLLTFNTNAVLINWHQMHYVFIISPKPAH